MWRKLGHPSGWWWFGGSLNAGETPAKAAIRNLKRETSLELSPERFSILPHLNFYIWSERYYEPRDLGSHDIVFSYLIEPTSDEITKASLNLDINEYEKETILKEFNRNLIANDAGFNEIANKIVLDVYDELFM